MPKNKQQEAQEKRLQKNIRQAKKTRADAKQGKTKSARSKPSKKGGFFAGISNEYGYDRIFDWLEYSKTELPLMCGILKELPEPESPKKTVYVMHMPPAGLRLGQLLYQDLDIGSVDIYEFLKAKQPLLSLHGHIHESPDTEKGSWMNQIGTTTCIQPGQTEFGDSSMVYAEIDLKSGVYARRIVNI